MTDANGSDEAIFGIMSHGHFCSTISSISSFFSSWDISIENCRDCMENKQQLFYYKHWP